METVKGEFPHRAAMLDELVYCDTLRTLVGEEIIGLLGEPYRRNGNYLYYEVERDQAGFVTLHTTTLVIKVTDSLDLVMIHELRCMGYFAFANLPCRTLLPKLQRRHAGRSGEFSYRINPICCNIVGYLLLC